MGSKNSRTPPSRLVFKYKQFNSPASISYTKWTTNVVPKGAHNTGEMAKILHFNHTYPTSMEGKGTTEIVGRSREPGC